MTSVNNKPSTNPLDALGKLFGTVGKEAGSAVNEAKKLATEDINSIGKGIESGGFIGGALQFYDVISPGHVVANGVDVLTGKGALDPKIKEGISAATNVAYANPMVLKDLFDLFNAPTTPGVKPSAPQQAVPPPDVDQLRGGANAPKFKGDPDRTGFAEQVGPETRNYEVHIVEVRGAHQQLVEYCGTLEQLRNNPEFAKRFPEAKYALDQKDWSLSAQSSVLVMSVLRDDPAVMKQVQDVAAENGVTTTTPTLPPPPTAQTGAGDFSQVGNQLMDFAKGAMGMLGQAFSFLGPILSNPAVVAALTPIIGGALVALDAVIPGTALLAPLVPVLLPLIGTGMTMAGGMMTGAAGGAPAPAGADPLAGLLGAGPSAGGLGDLLGPLAGLLGGEGGAGGLGSLLTAAAPLIA